MQETDYRRATQISESALRTMERRLVRRMVALGLATRSRRHRRAWLWWNVRNRLVNMRTYRRMKGIERAA